ncbi:MAG: hypothetical protein ACREJB_05250 [Planctomycetaceae bacterium]
MDTTADEIRTLDDLRSFVHRTLCEKENLLPDQFTMTEMQLFKRSRVCGLQFSLHGPRSVRLGAIWARDHNTVYLYDAGGQRYRKIHVRRRLHGLEEVERRPA